MVDMHKIGILALAMGIILVGYGVKLGQDTDTENIASYICLSCLGLTPSGYETGIEHDGLEKLSQEIELIVFSAEWCKSCPKAIDIIKEIAESSEFIEYRVIKYEEEPEEFENFGVDLDGLPVTVITMDGEIIDVLDGAFKLDSRILEVLENFAGE